MRTQSPLPPNPGLGIMAAFERQPEIWIVEVRYAQHGGLFLTGALNSDHDPELTFWSLTPAVSRKVDV